MRALLVLLGLAVLVLAGLLYFNIISIGQTQAGVVRAPKFNAEVGRVSLGTKEKTVQVPTIDVEPAGNAAAPR